MSPDGSHAVPVLPSQRHVQGAPKPHDLPPYVHVPAMHLFSMQ
jgi:hypothetical protein